MWIAVAIVISTALPASAQGRKGSWEVAPGIIWFAGTDLGSSAATLERPGGGEFELFRTSTSQEGAIGAAVAVSFQATPKLTIEVAFSYARPGIATRVTADAEDAPSITATAGLQQYLVEGGARWYLTRSIGRFRPFLRAGGGYLRQLDDDAAHVETGRTIHAGAGLDRAFVDRAQGRLRRIGARLEGRVIGRSGGFDVEDKVRVGFAAGAAVFFGF
jgi:hypothetical protein